jgi:hypothetical protein
MSPLYHIVSENDDGAKRYLKFDPRAFEWSWVGSIKKATSLPYHHARDKAASVRRLWRVRAKMEEAA